MWVDQEVHCLTCDARHQVPWQVPLLLWLVFKVFGVPGYVCHGCPKCWRPQEERKRA